MIITTEHYPDQFQQHLPFVLAVNINKEFPEAKYIHTPSKYIRLVADCIYEVDLIIAKLRSGSRS